MNVKNDQNDPINESLFPKHSLDTIPLFLPGTPLNLDAHPTTTEIPPANAVSNCATLDKARRIAMLQALEAQKARLKEENLRIFAQAAKVNQSVFAQLLNSSMHAAGIKTVKAAPSSSVFASQQQTSSSSVPAADAGAGGDEGGTSVQSKTVPSSLVFASQQQTSSSSTPAADAGSVSVQSLTFPDPRKYCDHDIVKKKYVEIIYIKTGQVLRIFPSQKSASTFLGISQASISQCCTGSKQSLYGFKFRFYCGPPIDCK
jgi:hypothetical protein